MDITLAMDPEVAQEFYCMCMSFVFAACLPVCLVVVGKIVDLNRGAK